MLSLNLHRGLYLRGTIVVLAVVVSAATLYAIANEAFAQTSVPGAPTDVAVYIYSTQTLEVRWSQSTATTTDSFKIQWKSGSEEFDSSRQIASGTATSTVTLQSTTDVKRYSELITGLTDDTEYTVRVIATNTNGDSAPSDEVTATPTDQPHTDTEQAGDFIEQEVVELFESSHPWLRETWDYIESESVQLRFHTLGGPPTYRILSNTGIFAKFTTDREALSTSGARTGASRRRNWN